MADELNFDEFPIPTYDEWYETAVQSLKGADFDKKLTTRTYEAITLQPLYLQADAAHQHTLPGDFPYVRGTQVAPRTWEIAQALPLPAPADFNAALIDDLARGQTAVNLVLDAATRAGNDPDAQPDAVGRGGVSVAVLDDLKTALQGVDLKAVPLYVDAGYASPAVAALIGALTDPDLKGGLLYDPLALLAETGTLPAGIDTIYDEMGLLVHWAAANRPDFTVIGVDATPYHAGGASAVQEIAYILATATDTIRALLARKLEIDDIARQMRVVVPIGGHFFMEIAKLRALRMLWAQMIVAFDGSADVQKIAIHAHTGRFNKTLYDPYVNMLRTTTEALSAALGGVDSLHVDPFDAIQRPPDEFSRRIARNQQVILQREVNLSALIDPAGGSYFVENLTDELARSAWTLFQGIESEGGMLAALQHETIVKAVSDVGAERTKSLNKRKDRLVGTNMYANLGEPRAKPDPTDYDAVASARVDAVKAARLTDAPTTLTSVPAMIEAAEAGASIGQILTAMRSDTTDGLRVTPILTTRLATPFEMLRDDAAAYADANGHPPQIFMANLGPLKQHKARADFTRGFFEVGGFEMVDTPGFETPEAAAQAALDADAGAVVICSTDADYETAVPIIAQKIKDARPQTAIILAGYPKDKIDDYKAAGVDLFIYLGADCHALNLDVQQRLGVVG